MKNRKNDVIKLFSLAVFLIIFSTAIHAQDSRQVKDLIESKNFVFKAQTVTPLSGRSRQLTSEYDMRVIGDSIVTYLPYFGRAYSGIDPTEGGIHFTSTKFNYASKERKKGGWEITIKPQDTNDVRILNLTITDKGYAYLNITSNNRQSISYNGVISGIK